MKIQYIVTLFKMNSLTCWLLLLVVHCTFILESDAGWGHHGHGGGWGHHGWGGGWGGFGGWEVLEDGAEVAITELVSRIWA